MCFLQSFNGDQKNQILSDILLNPDNKLLPALCQALIDTGQAHIAEQLGYRGEL